MKLLKYYLLTALAVTSVNLYSADYSGVDEISSRDDQALREFTSSKLKGSLADKMENINLSGDIRLEYNQKEEKRNGHHVLGNNSKDLIFNTDKTKGPNSFLDVEVHMAVDYECNDLWGVFELEWDNNAGVENRGYESDNALFGSGSSDNIAVRKAYVGYHVIENDCAYFDIEFGRRNLDDVFISKVQFDSVFDGILLDYGYDFESFADTTLKYGVFLVDNVSDHFGYVVEGGLHNIMYTDLDLTYTYTHWKHAGRNRAKSKDPIGANFQISQLGAAWKIPGLGYCGNDVMLFGALLHNHTAKKTTQGRQDFGWYLGAQYGKVRKRGDVAAEIRYEWVQAQVVPDRDNGGVTRGTSHPYSRQTFEAKVNEKAGTGNYKAVYAKALIGLAKNLSLELKVKSSRAINKNLLKDGAFGGSHAYNEFKVTTIFAF